MVEKRRRQLVFVSQLPLLPTNLCTTPHPLCRRRKAPTCAAAKLLVTDLQHMLRNSSPESIKLFSKRVEVDRSSSQDKTYVLYISSAGYSASMDIIKQHSLIEPDALSTLNGSELYQQFYKTPDPYWAKTVRKGWDPKPTRWVVDKFFGDDLDDCHGDDSEEFELVFQPKTKKEVSDGMITDIESKLQEMGINARVKMSDHSDAILVIPAAGSVSEVVEFCQMMLQISEHASFLYGSNEFLSGFLSKSSNLCIGDGSQRESCDDYDRRLFVSEKNGMDALVDGVIHYAIF